MDKIFIQTKSNIRKKYQYLKLIKIKLRFYLFFYRNDNASQPDPFRCDLFRLGLTHLVPHNLCEL